MTVIHKKGSLNTNADGLSRCPKDAPQDGTILLDWNKGDYNISPETVLAFMGEETPDEGQVTHTEI